MFPKCFPQFVQFFYTVRHPTRPTYPPPGLITSQSRPSMCDLGIPPLDLPYAVIKADSLSTMREGIPPEHA